ncbi:MmgE/PrpD family protein [Elioraea tepidiphila]|jgi:2-methylcitrate dehydratase PrpD|uniref:MmgE/PrpD family protein n=1 Tax=Elioraea tepidiphila TaxID=457934 RepID=UPI002FD9FCC3
MNVIRASQLTVDDAWLDRWSRFAAGLRFQDIPASVAAHARLVLLDTIGAIAAGAQEPEMVALTCRMADLHGTGGVTTAVIGGRTRLPLPVAAFLNGTAGTMLELDEGNQYCRGHPAIHVVPAALAAADRRGASGGDLIRALVLGYEIGARIGIASTLRVTMHPHGTWGTVGAAVAVASLAGVDAATMRETINVASTLGLATSRRTMLQGGTVRNTYAGVANELGLTAVELVGAGFVGEPDGVATVFGTVSADDFRPHEMTHELGSRWEIARNYFKRHAACRYTHGALDALGAILAETGPVAPDDVAALEVDTYVWAAQLDDPAPRNMLAAKFSLPFALATLIVNGNTAVASFRDPARLDAATRALAARVTVREDEAFTAALPALRPARVTLALRDGRRVQREVTTNRGDTEAPYPPEEVVAKFTELAAPTWGTDGAAVVRRAVETIDTMRDVRALTALLAG